MSQTQRPTERPYLPITFANEFIRRAHPKGATHMKLQKLVYCAYGWWLAEHDLPILSEAPQVWQHGPVFASLFRVLSHAGGRPIANLQRTIFSSPPPAVPDGDGEAHALLDWTWEEYGHMSAFDLSDMTHEVGTPWYTTAKRHEFRVPKNLPIEDNIIRDHFRSLAEERGVHFL